MLEVKNLVKVYSTKGGVTVRALDDVSVKFPDKGMVFLLGKSGSGKSTLLNVTGGLDRPDSGEIIVKGKSSKDFSASDFDSYRNTFIGFIFQEYNILNEFTVEQNISLALQLQSKPADKQAVEEILEQVDLKGFGKRKPNTLSGGQKQRVAIARALIKNPEIIMADEPTGALDSNTGKQVFDTLKKLSKDKLVIIVSHDRDFAEYYADRIIELKDGKILYDETKNLAPSKSISENVNFIDGVVSIKDASAISESDMKEIFNVLKSQKGEVVIASNQKEVKDVKRICRIHDSGEREFFKETEDSEIKATEFDGKDTKFIKSKLPLARAFKMGASGLKTKPFRLIFTILLSVVAFVMFGVVSTFMLYDSSYSVSEALKEADYPSAMIAKYYKQKTQQLKINNATGESKVDDEWVNDISTRFGESEIEGLNKNGLDYAGMFNFTDNSVSYVSETKFNISLKVGTVYKPIEIKSDLKYYYPVTSVCGFTDCGVDYMSRNGFTLIAGKYPESKTEIAIPEYVANLFINTDGTGVTTASQMVGKTLKFSGNSVFPVGKDEFTVSGVYKTFDIPSKYDGLKSVSNSSISQKEQDELIASLTDYLSNGFDNVIYTTKDFYDEYKGYISSTNEVYIQSVYTRGLSISLSKIDYDVYDDYNSYLSDSLLKDYGSMFKFYKFDGTELEVDTLAKNEGFVSENLYMSRLLNKLNGGAYKLYEYRIYDPEAFYELGDESVFKEVIGNIYSGNNYKTVEGYLNTWYSKLNERAYLYTAAQDLINNFPSEFGDPSEFYQTKAKIDAYISGLYDPNLSAPAPTDADWDAIRTVINDNYVTRFPYSYYMRLAQEMVDMANSIGMYSVFDDRFYGAFQNWDESSLAEKTEILKEYIDEYYLKITGVEPGDFGFNTDAGYDKIYYKDVNGREGEINVLGYYAVDSSFYNEFLLSYELLSEYVDSNESEYSWVYKVSTDYVAPADAKYNGLISKTDNSQTQIYAMMAETDSTVLKICNGVYDGLMIFIMLIEELQTVFLIIGGVVGVFAALMLLNFISISISAKRKDIGILRAVGARGADVFRIFFAESFIIALICFVLSSIGSGITCSIINNSVMDVQYEFINTSKLLNFNVINVGLILVISFVVSAIATFIPVFIASKKPPVESIRAL